MNKEIKKKKIHHLSKPYRKCVPSCEIGFVVICFLIIKGLIKFIIPIWGSHH
jgi:hypothetical protein